MNFTDIAILRLINQQIVDSKYRTAKDLVASMGAMQAQDFNMVKWAIGTRIPGSTDKLIESAIDKGEILRTHLLRPTWHIVSADDIYWMLELTAPQIRTITKSRDKDLELDEFIYAKSAATIEKALSGGKHLLREELVAELEKAHIATDNNRASHLLMRAEIDGLVCSGSIKAKKQTYALLRERVLLKKILSRDEALALLAQNYFTSHCPATLQDFIWWSGLSVADSKKALEMVKSKFISETIGNQTYWLTNSFSIPKIENDLIHVLPAYDEFLISYKDRTVSLPFESNNKAVSNNGIFRPIIVYNGKVIGIWRRTINKDRIIIETTFFQMPDKTIKLGVKQAFIPYGDFNNKKVEIID